MRRTTRRKLVFVLLLAVVATGIWYRIQSFQGRYVDVQFELSPSVAATLDTAYRQYETASPAPEYAYCINAYRVRMQADSTPLVSIDSVFLAEVDNATPQSIEYSCGPYPALHSHPPTDCRQHPDGTWTCVMTSDTTDLCEPSYDDVRSTLTDWHRFHGVQCGRRRFSFFVPDFLGS